MFLLSLLTEICFQVEKNEISVISQPITFKGVWTTCTFFKNILTCRRRNQGALAVLLGCPGKLKFRATFWPDLVCYYNFIHLSIPFKFLKLVNLFKGYRWSARFSNSHSTLSFNYTTTGRYLTWICERPYLNYPSED